MNNNTYTFWKLISKNSIEIPIIQRDYAQGRQSAKEIRNDFLDALHSHITNGETLDIDFVYGSLDSDVLIPLDGQQRLTTLFLLHWYLANKEGRNDVATNILKKFTYKTRASSRMFCSALVAESLEVNESNGCISDHIKDRPWFYYSWERDPTVAAMLVMLDAIEKRFKSIDLVFDKLIDEEKQLITFQFIELEKYGLTDKLYIKMNARGKPLTKFESFKAQLERALTEFESSGEPVNQKLFSEKLDGNWTDLFWNYRNTETNVFDNEFFNIFRTIATCSYGLSHGGADLDKYLDVLRDKDRDISFNKLAEIGCITPAYIKYVSLTLDKLTNGNQKIRKYFSDIALINEDELFESSIKNNLDYAGLVTFYGFTRYITTYEAAEIDDKFLLDWMRVIRNLVEGSRATYFNTAREFSSSLNTVEQLLPHAQSILNYLSNPTLKLSGFIGVQVDEEILKANLLLLNDDWAVGIKKMENHGYFNGQIEFLLGFAGITEYFVTNKNLEWDSPTNDLLLNRLRFFYDKASTVFNEKGLIHIENFRWERALLAIGDYMLTKGQNFSFLINNDRDISWKRLLRDKSENRDFVKVLLEEIDVQELDNSLKIIIDKFDDDDDWRYYFIKRPKTIKACGFNKFIRFNYDGFEVLLLESSKTSAYHSELYSYALMLRLVKDGNKCDYEKQKSYGETKYIKSINNRSVNISFDYVKSLEQWRYSVKLGRSSVEYFELEDEVVDYLKVHNYSKETSITTNV